VKRVEEDEEHADVERSFIESGSVLENLGAELTVFDLDRSPEDEDLKELEGIDHNRLLLYTLATSSTLMHAKCVASANDVSAFTRNVHYGASWGMINMKPHCSFTFDEDNRSHFT